MTPLDYEFLRRFLKERSGLDLSSDKQYLVESRLIPLARKAGLPGIGELVQKLKGGAEPLTSEVVEAMTTNETFFFRDKIPFDHLKEAILPALVQARASRRALRIWCAASSTGQEPYSIAMCVKEFAALAGWRVEIVATDLSQEVLEKSKAGIYSQFEVQRGLPIQMLVKYFKQIGELWQINADIRGNGAAPAAQPAAGFLPSRNLRPDLLPQRPDLFRPGHQGRRSSSGCRKCSNPTACWRWGRPNPWSEYPTPSSPIRNGAGSIARTRPARRAPVSRLRCRYGRWRLRRAERTLPRVGSL